MKITLTVCNICKDREREAASYVIIKSRQRVNVDLCEEHGKPLEVLIAATTDGAKVPPAKRGGRRIKVAEPKP